ncbi:MAG TPA: hypothetical protein VMK16_12910 [Acidimicrobiales bacterium]|nr:hypothetical protein [Acidimicrobiales bacterium]
MRRPVVAGILVAWLALVAGCGGGGDDTTAPADSTKYCDAVRTGQASLSGDVQDPQAAQAAVSAFDQLEASAPATIKADVRTVAQLVDKIAAADPSDKEEIADLFAAALDPSFLAASKRMQQFTQLECGIDLGGATPSLTTP